MVQKDQRLTARLGCAAMTSLAETLGVLKHSLPLLRSHESQAASSAASDGGGDSAFETKDRRDFYS